MLSKQWERESFFLGQRLWGFSHIRSGLRVGWGEVGRRLEGRGDGLGRCVVAIARESPYLPLSVSYYSKDSDRTDNIRL